jgi:SAM-dependent methyltransferase
MDIAHQTDNEQATLWNGLAGRAWVETQESLDQMFKPFEDCSSKRFPSDPKGRVLDVGCGTGRTTLAVARLLGAKGRCIGIDISDAMIAAARSHAERESTPASFVCANAQAHGFEPASFDTIISRFGVMFFDDSIRAFANLRRAATDNARAPVRCLAECGGKPVHDDGGARRGAAPAEPPRPPAGRAGPVRLRE